MNRFFLRPALAFTLCAAVFVVWSASPRAAAQPAKEAARAKESSAASETALKLDGLKLRSIGPALTSGRISSIAVHPAAPRVWYVAAASGGVWKSPNAGVTWQAIFENEGSYSIGCVAIDPNNPHTIWVGTGENNSQRSVGYGDGVYRSDDGGASWKNMGLQSSEHIARIVIDPRNSNVVYVAAQGPLWSAGGERGVYKSDDGGKTWKRSLYVSENTGATDLVFDPRNPDILYAAAYQRRRHVWTLIDGGPESAVYKSTDAGATWQKIEKGLPSGEMGRVGLAIAASNPDILYAQVEAANKKGGLYRSLNRGATWEKRNSFDATAMYYGTVYVDPRNADSVYIMNTYTMVSHDGGKTLQRLPEKSKHVDSHAMWIDPDNTNHLLIGCDGGLYESFDRAANWRHTPNLSITQFYRVSVDNAAPFYNVYGGTQDNFSLGGPSRTTSINGITSFDWFVTQGGDGFKSQVDPENPDIIYAQLQYGGLTRFDKKSGERAGIQPQHGANEEPYRWNWDAPLIISPHSPTRLYFAANKLFRSDDRGNSWKTVSPDLTRRIDRDKLPVMGKIQSVDAVARHASTAFYGNISAIAESPKQEGLIVVGTDDGLVQITNDAGATWRKIENIAGIPANAYVSFVACSQHDAATIYVGFDNHKNGDFKPYIVKSADGGKTWSSLRGNLPQNGMVLSFAEDHITPNLLFLGTEFGAFASVNGGGAWLPLKGNLPTIPVRDLAIQRRENDLVLASFGRGIYILDDYSPLRALAQSGGKALLAQEGVIFPVKDALLYAQSSPFGGGGKSFLGETFFTADNPPFGATFTVYLRESLKTQKQRRQEAEKTGAAKLLSPEEVRAEEEEESPAYMATVFDAAGTPVRRLSLANAAGFQRVAWNLRYAEITLNSSQDDDEADNGGGSTLAMPGVYAVQLAKRERGVTTTIGEPVSFTVAPLANATLPAKDRKALVEFQRKASSLLRSASGAAALLSETQTKISALKKALWESEMREADSLRAELSGIEARLNALNRALSGDRILAARNENTPNSILSRLRQIAYEQYRSTSEPTQEHLNGYAIAAEEFARLQTELREIAVGALPRIERALEAAGAPHTPGRIPEWKERRDR